MPTILTGHTLAQDAVTAARQFYDQVHQAEMALVLFFCSSRYDQQVLAGELNRLFGETPVIGCTTAGEIGIEGCQSFSLSGMSFPAPVFTVATGLLGPLESFEVRQGKEFAEALNGEILTQSSSGQLRNPFAFLMIDGLSQREESVLGSIHNNLPEVPIIGGSAADDLQFRETTVFARGRFHRNHAVMALVDSSCPVSLWKSQHFEATDQRMVITAADTANRRVIEINGLPAAAEYARLTGADIGDLEPNWFASSPVVVLVNGKEYVRSIQRVNDDGSLTFYCAIEEGLVIRVARALDLYRNLESELQEMTADIGQYQAILACDCVLRRLELEQNSDLERIGDLLRQYRVTGFHSYGEQIGGVHVNQTFTALAIGEPGGARP